MTYQLISSTHFQLNNVDQAITTYETAMDMLEEPAESDYEYLISLYLYDNRYDKAIDLSEEALDNYEGNSVFVQFRSEEHRLNSSHVAISYAVFCLKKKNMLI